MLDYGKSTDTKMIIVSTILFDMRLKVHLVCKIDPWNGITIPNSSMVWVAFDYKEKISLKNEDYLFL